MEAGEFIGKCREYMGQIEAIVKQEEETSRASNDKKGRKRRIKPTVISSFGLTSSQVYFTANNSNNEVDVLEGKLRTNLHVGSHHSSNKPVSIVENDNELVVSLLQDSFSGTTGEWIPNNMDQLIEAVQVARCLHALMKSKISHANNVFLSSDLFMASFHEFISKYSCSSSLNLAQLLLQLTPSKGEVIKANLFLQLLLNNSNGSSEVGESASGRKDTSLVESDQSGEVMDGIPVAYADRRDSRNNQRNNGNSSVGMGAGLIHANQQKIRDRVLEWIRKYQYQKQEQGPSTSTAASSMYLNEKEEDLFTNWALQIIGSVREENFLWLADFLIHEFEQLEWHYYKKRLKGESSSKEEQQQDQNKNKMDLLEERLTSKTRSKSGTANNSNSKAALVDQNAVVQFVKMVGSAYLNEALQNILFNRIESLLNPIIDGTNRTQPRLNSDIWKLGNLGRLLAVVGRRRTIINNGRYEDAVCCFMRELVEGAERDHYFIAIIPLIYSWRNVEIVESVLQRTFKRMSSGSAKGVAVSAARLLLKIILESMVTVAGESRGQEGEENNDCSTETSSSVALVSCALDEDESILGSCVEGIATYCLPNTFPQLLTAINQINSPLTTNTTAAPLEASLATRTVRPINTNEQSDTQIQSTSLNSIQKRLRQWFWWQHPVLKELLTDVLIRYLVDSAADTDCHNEEYLSRVANILLLSIPPLLPPVLQSHPHLSNLVIALVLEQVKEKLSLRERDR